MNKLMFLVLKPVRFQLHTIRHASMMQNVFVYGTLKRGEPNHYWLKDKNNGVGRFYNKGVTKALYPLIIATKYNIPFILYKPGTGYNIQGEIYEVDDDMLAKLDILEDHPNYYIREKDDILINSNLEFPEAKPRTMRCWVYFLKNYKPELIQRQHYESYSSTGPHGQVYMDRSKRDSTYDHKTEIKPVKPDNA